MSTNNGTVSADAPLDKVRSNWAKRFESAPDDSPKPDTRKRAGSDNTQGAAERKKSKPTTALYDADQVREALRSLQVRSGKLVGGTPKQKFRLFPTIGGEGMYFIDLVPTHPYELIALYGLMIGTIGDTCTACEGNPPGLADCVSIRGYAGNACCECIRKGTPESCSKYVDTSGSALYEAGLDVQQPIVASSFCKPLSQSDGRTTADKTSSKTSSRFQVLEESLNNSSKNPTPVPEKQPTIGREVSSTTASGGIPSTVPEQNPYPFAQNKPSSESPAPYLAKPAVPLAEPFVQGSPAETERSPYHQDFVTALKSSLIELATVLSGSSTAPMGSQDASATSLVTSGDFCTARPVQELSDKSDLGEALERLNAEIRALKANLEKSQILDEMSEGVKTRLETLLNELKAGHRLADNQSGV